MQQVMRSRVWWLALCVLLSACGGTQQVIASYKGTPEFGAAAPTLPPGSPDAVKVYEASEPLPPGVHIDDQRLMVAVEFPSPESPHRDLGQLTLRETVDYNVSESIFDTPEIVARRTEILKRVAAERGGNAVFRRGDQVPEGGRRNVYYRLVALSPAAPAFPPVVDVLARLGLRKDGYREVRRFTAALADLPTRTERVQLTAGHEYMLAMAYHPEPVELGLPDGVSLAFLVKVDRDAVLNSDREGSFAERIDRTYDEAVTIPGVDGVFARGGAGTMGGRGRSMSVEFVSRPATIRFTAYKTMRGVQPLERLGAGKADFVVYERRVPRERLVDEACAYCMNSARSCNKRKPLEACEELRSCFRSIEQPMSMCSKAYDGI